VDMFGLNKLTLKTKIIIVSITIIVISTGIVYIRNTYPISVVKIDDWVFIVITDDCSFYYKSNLVNIDSKSNIITVWVKCLYTYKGKQNFLNKHKEATYIDIDRSLCKVLINYKTVNFHIDRVVYYSKSDNIIGSAELYIRIDDFIPKSVYDKLLIRIVKDYNIKR
jgi:hypothetical protein